VDAADTIADIGAGAGFPGLVLAAVLPDARVDLIEAAARKCRVIERLAGAARLANARAIAERAESWGAGDGALAYDVVTARALAPMATLVEYAAPLLRDGGGLIAYKGARDPGEECAGLSAAGAVGLELVAVSSVQPFPQSRVRHLHHFRKARPTPDRFPRRPGMARKRPLA